AELHPLKLLNDRFETLDFGVAMFDRGGDIANQAMQKRCICREIIEIELHVRCYSNTLIRRSDFVVFDAGFCGLSAGQKWTPEAFRRAPVDALDQHRELRWCQRHRAAGLRHARPPKASVIDALGEQAQPRAIPKQDLQQRGLPAAEDEQMTREGVLLQVFLDQRSKS